MTDQLMNELRELVASQARHIVKLEEDLSKALGDQELLRLEIASLEFKLKSLDL